QRAPLARGDDFGCGRSHSVDRAWQASPRRRAAIAGRPGGGRMNLAPFESLLKAEIGLDAASIGSSAVERAVKARAVARDAGDATAYLERLRHSPDELAELIDAVVVPETWFFRDRGAFSVLERFVHEEA